ncbi:methyltransferase domain-containing protein [Phenylobacterium sp.]|uniref:methyltransferase domain-containing protein n=1 Tax=Phenylobacterium sp. TaxID=1871053 RepID=UPI0027316E46|nr:methyltransferase domain-containing protein [Phenylobacterium sp.]MDP1875055.1 methyltransferase domain-containing protein [Phenylobacterium sp.]
MTVMGLDNARAYYGEVLTHSGDLRTDACATAEAPPLAIRQALSQVHDDVRARYYGCGLVAPQALDGARILDLGCGSGQDVYVLSQLTGPAGHVVGVDATAQQLEVARRHEAWHQARFGYPTSNVTFLDGDIARLEDLGLEAGSYDVIVSNCVINLVEDKAAVFAAAWRLLKPGGELYFSDVYADRRVPETLRRDPVLHGECLAGALYWGDFLGLAKGAGFGDPRLVSDRPLGLNDLRVKEMVAPIAFFSATYRLFKLEELEPACEDYGQAVRYRGTIPGSPGVFTLDKHHNIETGRLFPVCGNTWRMLAESRLAPHFEFMGDRSRHFGVFKGCGLDLPFSPPAEAGAAGGCC